MLECLESSSCSHNFHCSVLLGITTYWGTYFHDDLPWCGLLDLSKWGGLRSISIILHAREGIDVPDCSSSYAYRDTTGVELRESQDRDRCRESEESLQEIVLVGSSSAVQGSWSRRVGMGKEALASVEVKFLCCERMDRDRCCGNFTSWVEEIAEM